MSLGFNHENPVSFDHSRIIMQNRTGDYLAQGMAQAGQGLGQGIGMAIQDYRKKKEEKEQTDAFAEWAKSNGVAKDDAEAKVAVKAAGGPQNAMRFVQEQEHMKAFKQQQEEQARMRQIQQMQQQAAQDALTERPTTLQRGQGPVRPEALEQNKAWNSLTAAERYGLAATRRGLPIDNTLFDNFISMDRLAASRKSPAPKIEPGTERQLSDGSKVFWTGAQYSPLPTTKEQKSPTQTVSVGGKTMTVGPGNRYFDENGNVVQLDRRMPKAPDMEVKVTDPELYDAMRSDYVNYMKTYGTPDQQVDESARARPGAASSEAASGEITMIKSKVEFDALPKGAKFKLADGRIGTKK